MKKDLHPDNYRPVVFKDVNNDATFVTRSTVKSTEKITLDGTEYPMVSVHISSASHPFYTGEEKIVDVEGRVDRFKKQAEQAEARKQAAAAKAKKSADRKAARGDSAQAVQKIGEAPTKSRIPKLDPKADAKAAKATAAPAESQPASDQ